MTTGPANHAGSLADIGGPVGVGICVPVGVDVGVTGGVGVLGDTDAGAETGVGVGRASCPAPGAHATNVAAEATTAAERSALTARLVEG